MNTPLNRFLEWFSTGSLGSWHQWRFLVYTWIQRQRGKRFERQQERARRECLEPWKYLKGTRKNGNVS